MGRPSDTGELYESLQKGRGVPGLSRAWCWLRHVGVVRATAGTGPAWWCLQCHRRLPAWLGERRMRKADVRGFALYRKGG